MEQICGILLILLRRKTGVFSEMGFAPTSILRVVLESRKQTLYSHVKRTLFLSDISQIWDSLAKSTPPVRQLVQ